MNEAVTSEQQPPQFSMEKLYVKDLSLESPNTPAIFLEREVPHIDLQLQTQHSPVEDGIFEVTLTATVTAKLQEKNKVMFLIEATQAGIFQVRNIKSEELEPILETVCPNILYPYLREVVSSMSVKAGFTPILLNPINFEAVYQQKKQRQAQAATEGAPQ